MKLTLCAVFIHSISAGTRNYVVGYRDHSASDTPLYQVPAEYAAFFPRTPGMAIRGPNGVMEYIPRQPDWSTTSQRRRNEVAPASTSRSRVNPAPDQPRNQVVSPAASSREPSRAFSPAAPPRVPAFTQSSHQRAPRGSSQGSSQGNQSSGQRVAPASSSRAPRNPPPGNVPVVVPAAEPGRRRTQNAQSTRAQSSSRSDRGIVCDSRRRIEPPPLPLNRLEEFLGGYPVHHQEILSLWTQAGGPQLVHNLMCPQSTSSNGYSMTPSRTEEQLRSVFIIASHILGSGISREGLFLLKQSRRICSHHLKEVTKFMHYEYLTLWNHRNSIRHGSRYHPFWNFDVVCPTATKDALILRFIVLQRVVRVLDDRPRRLGEIRPMSRANVLESTVSLLGTSRTLLALSTGFSVTFDGERGNDVGGVTAEWVTLFGKAMISQRFVEPVSGGMFTLNAAKTQSMQYSRVYMTFGRMLAISLLTDTYLGIPISLGIAKYLIGESIRFSDLKIEDPQIYSRMNLSGEELEGLDLQFTATDRSGKEVALKPNGDNIKVTKTNANEWKNLMAKWRLVTQIEKGGLEFVKKGFDSMLKSVFGTNLNADQVRRVFSGNTRPSKQDLIKMIVFTVHGGSSVSDTHRRELQEWIHRFINSLSDANVLKFMNFGTGMSVVDYKPITVQFTDYSSRVHRNRPANWDGNNQNSFPESHTCTRTIDLPLYTSYETLKEKFLTALTHGSGNIDRF